MNEPYIEVDIFDYVTVNGRISKKLCEKVFVAKIDELSNKLEESQLANAKLLKAFENLRRHLGNGEHVDASWIKDEVEMQASNERLMKAKHYMEIKELNYYKEMWQKIGGRANLQRLVDDFEEAVHLINGWDCLSRSGLTIDRVLFQKTDDFMKKTIALRVMNACDKPDVRL